jgi:SAM-dependent methyltransferase
MRLDLACGTRCAAGYEGVDRYPMAGVAYTCDLTIQPWRLRDQRVNGGWFGLETDSVEALRASHIVEHLVDLVGFINECHRVLVPGGELLVICPYQFSVAAWQDPTHVRAVNEVTFRYFDAEWRRENSVDHYTGITADFIVRSAAPSHVSLRYMGAEPEVIAEAIATQVNVVHELTAVLVKR